MEDKIKSENIIIVRDTGNTYIARWQGKTASSTSCAKSAAETVAKKVMGDQSFDVIRLGTNYAWEVVRRDKT
jgi:hypothetical protein